MIEHPRTYLEHLGEEEVEGVLSSALDVLERTGMEFRSEEAVGRLGRSGARVDGLRVRFPRRLVEELLGEVPSRWTLHARNPERSVEVGGRGMLLCPGYGSPFVVDRRGVRRRATLEDFRKFALMAGLSDVVDITGGMLVEPSDVPPELRPLELTYQLIVMSDKPFFGSVAGTEGARESLRMAELVFGGLGRPVVMGLVNVDSPLRLEGRMAEALVEYSSRGQPVLVTPGIMMGMTAPVTAIGALVQAFAEIVACVCLAQAVRPGAPVVVGIGGFGSDLRDGGSGFGRPENALGAVLGAQVARRLGLPYRFSGGVTGSFLPDCRSGYERMMTALAGWSAGAHVCLQALGTLDRINSMCYEQFVVDMEVWGYVRRLAERPRYDTALDVISEGDYLWHMHTVRHMREEIYEPILVPPSSYEDWLSSGGKDVVDRASERLEDMLGAEPPPMERDLRSELEEYVASRRAITRR